MKFQRLGPPSAGRVLEAASLDAARALTRVQGRRRAAFLGNGKTVVRGRARRDVGRGGFLVARCLAAVARQNELRARSVLDGRGGSDDLIDERRGVLKTSDVVYAVSKLLERGRPNRKARRRTTMIGWARCASVANRLRPCLMFATTAQRLLAFCEEQNFNKFTFEVCEVLPQLQPQQRRDFNGGGGGYRGGGYRGGRGGGGGYRGGGGCGWWSRRAAAGTARAATGAAAAVVIEAAAAAAGYRGGGGRDRAAGTRFASNLPPIPCVQ